MDAWLWVCARVCLGTYDAERIDEVECRRQVIDVCARAIGHIYLRVSVFSVGLRGCACVHVSL